MGHVQQPGTGVRMILCPCNKELCSSLKIKNFRDVSYAFILGLLTPTKTVLFSTGQPGPGGR
jgi:hypothetical protein